LQEEKQKFQKRSLKVAGTTKEKAAEAAYTSDLAKSLLERGEKGLSVAEKSDTSV
jgi:hypothetical protein